MTDDPRILDQKRIQPLADALANLPTSHPEMAFQLMAISEEFRRQCAEALEPAINRYVQDSQPRSLEEHRDIARRIDEYTRWLGLCVAVEGKPGIPYGVTADPATGKKARFAVLVHSDKGRPPMKEKLDLDNPHFTLIPIPLNMETCLFPLREAVYSMRR